MTTLLQWLRWLCRDGWHLEDVTAERDIYKEHPPYISYYQLWRNDRTGEVRWRAVK